ncbi:MAG: hypothetical protein ACO4AZ_01555 [Ilumatobacteraceae bacterium]
MIWVKFTRHELMLAAMAGAQRRIAALEIQRPAKHGADDRAENNWQIDIVGTMGEMAVSKAYQKYWFPAAYDGNLKSLEGDVGQLQVRSTGWLSGHLLLYEYDKPETPYIFTIVREPHVKIVGWTTLEEARRIGDPRPSKTDMCYWVRQDRLRPAETLSEVAEREGEVWIK